jgi:hypothetical protein
MKLIHLEIKEPVLENLAVMMCDIVSYGRLWFV